MAKFNTNLADNEFDGKKIADQGNPLNGTVEENKAKFDAYPTAILMKLRAIVGELEEMFENKDLSANDFTTAFKEKLEGLENYDDAEIREELKKYADEKVAGIVNSAPKALDTLEELAKALGNDENFASTVTNLLSKKVDMVEGKGLSTNDFTNQEKEKLARLENYDDIALKNAIDKRLCYMGVIADDLDGELEFLKYRGEEYCDGYYFLGMFSTQNRTNIYDIGLFESLNAEGGVEYQRKFMFSDEGLKIYSRQAYWDMDYDSHTFYQGNFGDWELVKEITGGVSNFDSIKRYIDEQIGDIEEALDRIIEIQDELLGGDAE